ncbi:unnamed protein product [Cunninghamella echinulata]
MPPKHNKNSFKKTVPKKKNCMLVHQNFLKKLNNKRVVWPSTPPNDNIDSPELQIGEVEEVEDELEELEELEDEGDQEDGGGYLFEKRNEPLFIDIDPDQISVFDGMVRRDFYTKSRFLLITMKLKTQLFV